MIDRRGFLAALGIGAVALTVPLPKAEPEFGEGDVVHFECDQVGSGVILDCNDQLRRWNPDQTRMLTMLMAFDGTRKATLNAGWAK